MPPELSPLGETPENQLDTGNPFPRGLILKRPVNVAALRSTANSWRIPDGLHGAEKLSGEEGERLTQELSTYAAVLTKDPERLCFAGAYWLQPNNQRWGGYPGIPHTDPYALALRTNGFRKAATGIVARKPALEAILTHFEVLQSVHSLSVEVRQELLTYKARLSEILAQDALYPSTSSPQTDPVGKFTRDFTIFVGNAYFHPNIVFEYQRQIAETLAPVSFLQTWKDHDDLLFISQLDFHYLAIREKADLKESGNLERLMLSLTSCSGPHDGRFPNRN